MSVSSNSKAIGGEVQRFLEISLCGESYAIPLLKVREVIAMTEMTSIPHAPAHFKGIMNLRGQIISVVDLRVKFRMSKAEIKPETTIVIVDLGQINLGVIVDSVDSVLPLGTGEISPAPDIEGSVKSDFIQGVARKGERLVLILDIEGILNVEDLNAAKRGNQAKSAA